MTEWLEILTAEGLPWALYDARGQMLAAAEAENVPAAPPAGVPWPPPAPTAAECPGVGVCRLYPLENGRVLAVWGASRSELAAALEAERARLPKFLSTLTHELRLPLTSIKGYADLLVKGVMGPVSEPQAQFLGVIRNNVERMATLIERVSEMGKLESGRLRPQREPLAVKQAVEAVVAKYRPLCEEKGQALEADLPAGLPVVLGDMPRVVQILEALLDNAHKYTPEGGRITVRAAAAEGGVQVTVCDTGPGIAPKDAARMFEAFFRSEIPAVREHPGWGLSLHVAKQLAEGMGGALGFEPRPEGGVCFWLRLQAVAGDNTATAPLVD